MNVTTQTLYQNEVRPVTIAITKKDHSAFSEITSGSLYSVTDCDGTEVLEETNATVSSNTITAVIDTDVTGTVGDYFIIWKIIDENNYVYYHKTYLTVIELLNS